MSRLRVQRRVIEGYGCNENHPRLWNKRNVHLTFEMYTGTGLDFLKKGCNSQKLDSFIGTIVNAVIVIDPECFSPSS